MQSKEERIAGGMRISCNINSWFLLLKFLNTKFGIAHERGEGDSVIENRLEKCCEKCNWIDAHIKTEYQHRDNPEPHTVIWCQHMYVCREYRGKGNPVNASGCFARE